MTNRRTTADHNICWSSSTSSSAVSQSVSDRIRHSEGGYTLVALLAMMSVLALFAMAVAPSMQQQALREREKEAIFRGEQVADAIRLYYRYQVRVLGKQGAQALPSSMDNLIQGVPKPGGSKNLMILRASAARDPLTIEGEWRYVLPRTEALTEFQQAIMFYTGGNVVPQSRDREMITLQQFAVPPIINISNLGTKSSSSNTSSFDDDASGPFVGVASRSKQESVIAYYGIEQHNQWIFTPLFRN